MVRADLEYSKLLRLIKKYTDKGRTETQAFLNWFLENIYRLEETAADDCICDKNNDKGIDAIYVDLTAEEILVFQSRTAQNPAKTLGDTSLKEFHGSLVQISTPENIQMVLQGNANSELKRLLNTLKIADHLTKGFRLVGVFVTNAVKDRNAIEYLKHQENIRVYDADSIAAEYIDLDSVGGSTGEISLDCYGIHPLQLSAGSAKVIVTAALATDLVKCAGIEDGSVFSQNVRLDLGKTSVNKDIEKSIEDKKEHRLFPLYHNGITILCNSAETDGDKVKIKNYRVVNGAQSLSALYRKRASLSSDLKILTRIIEIQDPELALKITHNSNNQNAIKPRDLRSNSLLQVRLSKEFDSFGGKQYGFEIKRGQTPKTAEVISNEWAGRLLLAYDLQEPWVCHQPYKIFDELYEKIFGRPSVTAKRIVMIFEIMKVIEHKLSSIENKLFAHYSLTRFFILYIVSQILQQDTIGKALYQDPTIVIDKSNGLASLRTCMGKVVDDIIVDINAEAKELGETFDYKNILKSPAQVKGLAEKVIGTYTKLIARGRIDAFSQDWTQKIAEPQPQ
jgi:hypothetical protein